MENGRYPLGSPCRGYFSPPSEEGGEVDALPGVVSPWSGAHGTSHWAAQPWSMLHRLALGTQPGTMGPFTQPGLCTMTLLVYFHG